MVGLSFRQPYKCGWCDYQGYDAVQWHRHELVHIRNKDKKREEQTSKKDS